jgi:hypothetical protein
MADTEPTVYFSIDVEADGQSPIANSMLSLGIAVIDPESLTLVDTLSVNIHAREGAERDPDTMEWWGKNLRAWGQCQVDRVSPKTAMWRVAKLFSKWSKTHKIQWVAQPACYDWMWLKSYYDAFPSVGSPDIGYFCTDYSSLRRDYLKTRGMTSTEFRESAGLREQWMADVFGFWSGDVPDEDLEKTAYTIPDAKGAQQRVVEDSHLAVDDAIFQGCEFIAFLTHREKA